MSASATLLLFEGRTTHRVKSWPENFTAILTGRQTFDFRVDDKAPPYQCGDLIVLQEWVPPEQVDPDRKDLGELLQAAGFTRRQATFLIGFVARGGCMPVGWCCFELIPVETTLRVAAALLKRP